MAVVVVPEVVFVLGGPGAGKGTQCERIVKTFGYTHLSAGDLLRAERSRQGSEFSVLIEKCIREGSIVPVEITIALLKKHDGQLLDIVAYQLGLEVFGRIRRQYQAMEQTIEKDPSKKRFLIDGFPRNKDNLDGWQRHMGDTALIKFVLFFDCSNEVCIDRCLERGKSSGRSDDNRESLTNRIETYLTSTKPIIDSYGVEGKVRRVDASSSVDEVFAEVKKVFEKM